MRIGLFDWRDMQHEMELRIAIKEIIEALPKDEQTAVILRAQGYNQREIGDYLEVSQSTVSRMFKSLCIKHASRYVNE